MALLKENKLCYFSDEIQSFTHNSSQANFLQILPEKYPKNSLALNPQEKCKILSDPTLDYISRYLLEEEDVDEEITGYPEAALRDMEKPFYDILGQKYPPSQHNQLLLSPPNQNPNCNICIPTFTESLKQYSTIENLLATKFQKGVEEGMKLLPNLKKLSIDVQGSIKLSLDARKKRASNSLEFELGEDEGSRLPDTSALFDRLEGRNRKIPLFSCEETIRNEIFDKVLLNHGENYAKEEISSLRKIMELKEKSHNKNQYQEEHTNLRALLISCAEAIFMDSNKLAGELLNQIRCKPLLLAMGLKGLHVFLLMHSRHA